jgi:multidrug resistance efflux pump
MLEHHNNDRRLSLLEQKVLHMSQELDDLKASVALINKAVGEAVGEIKSLADQLAAVANKPNPEAADFESIAAELKTTAENLHSAVYPPSSHVPL